jgi:probable F420-dependent oxidoreductase
MKIGLMIYLANDRKTNTTRPYRSIRAIAQQAEADGFDSIWLPDHLLYRRPGEPTAGSWECWTMLAALAEATQRVEIGTLVLNNSLRNPAILATMATAVDEVSQGRLILGLGAGWNEPEYQSFGLPFDHRVGRLEEALQIVRPLLRDGHVDFQGRYYEARDCEDLPRGPRPQGPPLMVGGEGPRMISLAAQYADAWNIGYLSTPDTLAGPLAKLEAACHRVGRDPVSIDIIPLIGLWFPELEPEQPAIFPDPLTGSVDELVAVMRGYEELGVRHIIFQYLPYTPEALQRLTEAVRRYHGGE